MTKGKEKGDRYQRKIGKALAPWWGIEWDNPAGLFHGTPRSGGLHTPLRSAAQAVEEVRATEDDEPVWTCDLILPRAFPFSIECKNREGWTIRQHLVHGSRKNGKCPRNGTPLEWWDQTLADCPASKLPLLIFTARRLPDYILTDVRTSGFIWSRVGPWHELARFGAGGRLRLYTLDQLLELDAESLRAA